MKQRGEEGEKDESLHEKARQREVEKEGNEPRFFFFCSSKAPRLNVRILLPV